MNKFTTLTLSVLLLVPLAAAHAAEATTTQEIDRETLDKWSAPYRGWHYQPEHVIPAHPNIPGHTEFKNTDVPCVYQLPGQPDKWFMSFIGFNGQRARGAVDHGSRWRLHRRREPRLHFGRDVGGECGGDV